MATGDELIGSSPFYMEKDKIEWVINSVIYMKKYNEFYCDVNGL